MKKNAGKIWIIIEVAAAVVVIGAVVVKSVFAGSVPEGTTYSKPEQTASEVSEEDIPRPVDLLEETGEKAVMDNEEGGNGDSSVSENIYSMDYSDEIIAKLGEISTEQKVCMLIVTSPEALCDIERVKTAGDVFKASYAARPVEGLILSDENFETENKGMAMLKTLREWSRENTGMNLLLGYREQEGKGAEAISNRGFNLFCIPSGTEGSTELAVDAMNNNMVPSITMSAEEAAGQENEDGALIIVQSNDAEMIRNYINEGRRFLYSTDDMGMVDTLIEAVNSGEISAEAIDHAAGYGMSIRQTLTDNRPEETEKEPAEETTTPTTAQKPTTQQTGTPANTTTPEKSAEQQAAEAAQKQMEELAKKAAETQQQQEAGQNNTQQNNTEGQQGQ